MENSNISNSSFKSIQIIYAALMLGILIFSVAVYAFAENHRFDMDTNSMFLIAVPLVAISGVYLSKLVFTKIMSGVKTGDTLGSKLMKYQTATIVRAACLEGPAFLAVVASFISANMVFIGIAVLLVVVMYMTFPSKEKFKTAARLSMKEKTDVDKL